MMDAVIFLFAAMVAAGLLFGVIIFIIMFSDLESDYLNPIELCSKLNTFVIPEMGAHLFLLLLYLLNNCWSGVILNIPLFAWNAYRVYHHQHLFDITEIFRTLPQHKKECFIKLGFYLMMFFYGLYRMILSLVD